MSEPFTTMQDWTDKFTRAVGISNAAARVMLAMSRFATYTTGGDVRPSTNRLAYETGVSAARIRGANGHVSNLVSAGWLILVKPATRSSPAVFRLGIGEYRPDWRTVCPGGDAESDTEDDTQEVVPSRHDGSAVATQGRVVEEQGSCRSGTQGRVATAPNHPIDHPSTYKHPVRPERATDVPVQPDMLIDIPDTPKPQTKTARKPGPTDSELEAEFATWYAKYPRKESRIAASKAYKTARKTASAETIMAGLDRQAPELKTREKKFIPHPDKWLRHEKWDDDTDAGQGGGPNVHIRPWQPAADTPTSGPYRPSRALEAVMGSPARHNQSATPTDAYSVRN